MDWISKGRLHVAVVVLDLLSLGLTAGSYRAGNSSDEYALAIIILAFIFSMASSAVGLIIICVACSEDSDDEDSNDQVLPLIFCYIIENIGQGIFAFLLLIGWFVFAANTANLNFSGGQITARVFALIVNGLNIASRGFLPYVPVKEILGEKNNSQVKVKTDMFQIKLKFGSG